MTNNSIFPTNKKIDEIEFTIFDTETTGLEPQAGDRIVEIAAIRFKGNEKLANFQSLVNPHREISPAAFQVNRITSAMLQDAPDIAGVLPRFIDFIQDSCLCSYNAPFDMEFLQNELKLISSPGQDCANYLPQNFFANLVVVDVLKMAKRISPEWERHSLSYVADRLGIKTVQLHRAFSDVELTWEVFNKFKEILRTKGVDDFGNFSRLFGLPSNLLDTFDNQKVAQIQEAINLGVKLKIKYLAGSTGQVSEREILPKVIIQENRQRYLIAHCSLRNEERSFRVDSILHLEIL